MNTRKKRRLKKSFKLFVILTICIITLLISTYFIIKWIIDNKNINKINNEIEETAEIKIIEEENKTVEQVNPPKTEESDYWKYIKMSLIEVDFNDLLKKNNDTVGWIKVEGTSINYPVVQSQNNDFYLNHAYDKTKNEAGWIFADYRNNMKEFDKNTIIYGHGRLNTTMFGSLKNIMSSNWYKNSNNYIINFSTPHENTLWQVFSIYKIPTETYYLRTKFNNDSDYNDFLNTLKQRSIYNFNAELNSNDKIVTLSTCSNDNKSRIVMHAKLIKRQIR